MENVIVSSEESFKKLETQFIEGGFENLHVLADFDRTLTKGTVNGVKTPSIISELRKGEYIDEDYRIKSTALFEKYHPYENDESISFEERKAKMKEWWETHYDLIISKGITMNHLKQIVEKGSIQLRDGAGAFLDLLHEYSIPLVILSSTGLGEAIKLYLEKWGKSYDNIHIVSNAFEWSSDGRATGVKKPVIHTLNKDETVLDQFPFYEKVRGRKNVLLLGDSLGDVSMIKGFDYSALLRVGFLSYDVEKYLDSFKNHYEALVLHDGNFSFVNTFLKKLGQK